MDQLWKIIGAASGIGAGGLSCDDAPILFQQSEAWQQLKTAHPQIDWHETIRIPTSVSPDQRLSVLTQFCRALADCTRSLHQQGQKPLVLGGDHSCAIGTWSGIAQPGSLGLLWIDAHLDAHTPHTTPSGNYHGMPLACLLGYGENSLINIGTNGSKLSLPHVAMVGIRSYEEGEYDLLKRLNIRIYEMQEIKQRGLHTVLKEAWEQVRQAPGGYGWTIDLDAFDPTLIPGVATPEEDGLHLEEFCDFVKAHRCNSDPQLHAIEIVEYHPHRDVEGLTERGLAQLIQSWL